jgi:hypothetical protein
MHPALEPRRLLTQYVTAPWTRREMHPPFALPHKKAEARHRRASTTYS